MTDRAGRAAGRPRGATTGSGRPGSSSGRRSARRRPSSAGAPSGPRGGASSTGRTVERIAIAPAAIGPRHASTPAELRAAGPAYAEAMARIVPRSRRGARQPSCRASSNGPASSTGPAGSAPTPARSRRSSASSRRTCSTRSSRRAAAWPRRRWRSPIGGSRPASSATCSGSWARGSSASTTSRCCRPRPAPGRLLFVEENIRATARRLGVPVGPFRTWIALHETTHAFEFEAHPWLRPYLAERLERQLRLFGERRRGPRSRGPPRRWAGRSAARPAASTGWSG